MVTEKEYQHVKRNYEAVLRELETLGLPDTSLVKAFCESIIPATLKEMKQNIEP